LDARLEGEFLVMIMPISRINTCLCHFIMWFIFNLQRKNKQLEIAAEYMHIYKTVYKPCAVLIFLLTEHLLEPCKCKQAQTKISDFSGLMSLGY
jgi:hypothetical protein